MIMGVNILTGFFEAIVTLMYIDAYVEKNSKPPFYVYVVSLFIHTGCILLSNYIFKLAMLNVVLLAVFVFLEGFFFIRKVKTSAVLSVSLAAIFCITEILTLFVMTVVLGVTTEQITNVENYRILGTIFSKLFVFVLIKILSLRSKTNRVVGLKTPYWILFFLVFAVSTLGIYLLFILQYYSDAPGIYNNLAVWCSFGLLYSTFFSLYLYEKMRGQAEEEKNQEILQYQIKAQAKHVEELLIAQQELKKLRHDMQNHTIVIQSYFEKQECAAGLQYIREIQKLAEYTRKEIETGNITLDAMLNAKKDVAESNGILFKTQLKVPENLFVDPIDVCIIFGNALDNAIEACTRIRQGDKWIKLSLVYEREVLICKISNSAEKEKKNFLQTAKEDKERHGLGIGNIKAALEKYKSIYTFSQTDEEFTLFFKIFKKEE